MEATLKYSDSREDVMALRRAIKSLDMACVLFELLNNTKRKLEYDEDLHGETITAVFEEIYALVDKHNIIIDELIE